MKLLAAALPVFTLAAYDQNTYCDNEATDVDACKAALNSSGVQDSIAFCMKKESDRENCLASILADRDQDNNYATDEFAMNEFVNGIQDDAMLQSVLAELNTLSARLQSEGLTKSLPNGSVEAAAQADAVLAAEGDQAQLKRFVELKQLVSWLQPKDKRISRYCFYGCWCLPEGAHSFVAGEGRPVDLVDKACQYLWFCYTCAKQEFRGVFSGRSKECTPERQKYSFRFRYDKAHPAHYEKRDIICKDTFYNPMNTKDKWKSNCARAICECDRGLAKRLWRAWTHWDKSRHRIWSQKVTTCKQLNDCALLPDVTPADKAEKAACLKRGCLFIVKRRCLNSVTPGFSPDHAEICCGLYSDEGGRFEMRDHGGTHACCDHDTGTGNGDKFPWSGNWYNTITHCCGNGKVYNAGNAEC